MRVLYIASNPQFEPTLLIEHEVTKLQKHLRTKANSEVSLKFLPAIPFQELRNEVAQYRPDVIHVSAHGDEKGVYLSDARGEAVTLNADSLYAALGKQHLPRILYLSACHSAPVAQELSQIIPITIGTTDEIKNYFAWESSIAFYEELYSGGTVLDAFNVSRQLLGALGAKVTTAIFSSDQNILRKKLFNPPQLLARFSKRGEQRSGDYYFEPGFLGAPKNTTQIVYFTDDMTFVNKENTWEEDLCWVSRDKEYEDGIRWLDDCWNCTADFDLFATAVTQDGEARTVHAKVKDALLSYYSRKAAEEDRSIPQKVMLLIDKF